MNKEEIHSLLMQGELKNLDEKAFTSALKYITEYILNYCTSNENIKFNYMLLDTIPEMLIKLNECRLEEVAEEYKKGKNENFYH